MNKLLIEFKQGLKIGCLIGSSFTYIFTKIYIHSNYKLTTIKNYKPL